MTKRRLTVGRQFGVTRMHLVVTILTSSVALPNFQGGMEITVYSACQVLCLVNSGGPFEYKGNVAEKTS